MKLYPAIDIKDGKCVRLYRGNMQSATVYSDNILQQASIFQKMGFGYLHVVDLDGALNGALANKPLVERMVKELSIPIQLGGGIRDRATAEAWIEAGVSRIILGTTAIKNPELVAELARAHPEKVIVGIDARAGIVATDGWVEGSGVDYIELAKRFEDKGIAGIIYTDIDRDGTLEGPSLKSTMKLAEAVSIPVILSGGVKTTDHIAQIAAEKKIDGVVIGRALYVKTLDIPAALSIAMKAATQRKQAAKPVDDVW